VSVPTLPFTRGNEKEIGAENRMKRKTRVRQRKGSFDTGYRKKSMMVVAQGIIKGWSCAQGFLLPWKSWRL
jgi:hypothetical protein